VLFAESSLFIISFAIPHGISFSRQHLRPLPLLCSTKCVRPKGALVDPSIHPSIQLSLLQYYDRLESLRLRCLSQLRETEIVFQHEFMSLDSSFSVDWKSVRAQD
jgi:hypothetical protein